MSGKTDKSQTDSKPKPKPKAPQEIGGPKGLEPTRYGDWEKDGKCVGQMRGFLI
jgi:hypothetical protein